MKKWFGVAILLALFAQVSFAQSVYDLVKGEETATLKTRGEEQVKPGPSRIIPSVQFGSGVDFTTRQGTNTSLDFQLGFMIKSVLTIQCVSFGPVVGFRFDSQSTFWKAGAFSRVDFPVIIRGLLNPFAKLSVYYQDPGGDRPAAAVFAPSLGAQFLLGDKRRKYAAVDLELVYQLASKEIYFRNDEPQKHAFKLNASLKVYL